VVVKSFLTEPLKSAHTATDGIRALSALEEAARKIAGDGRG
jgi:hypothetical protein